MLRRLSITQKHILLILVATVVVRGVLFVSYPIGGYDDDQSYARWQIDRLISGDWQVGNLRYHTGYPLVIAPVAYVGQFLGSFSERFVLLVQIAVSSLGALFAYDILRRRFASILALTVSLYVALDPFGLQWAHAHLPNWLISVCLIVILWLMDRLHSRNLLKRDLLITLFIAGFIAGIAVLARINMLIVIVALGLLIAWIISGAWQRRALGVAAYFAGLATVLGTFLLGIQLPSTQSLRFSCYSGTNLLVSESFRQFELRSEDGPASRRYIELATRPPLHEITFFADGYARWANGGVWATPQEQTEWLAQNVPAVETLRPAFYGYLYHYMGFCQMDALAQSAALERILADPIPYTVQTISKAVQMLMHINTFDPSTAQWLPSPTSLAMTNCNGLGFCDAQGEFYKGHLVWVPGMWLYSILFPIIDTAKLLMPLVVAWALISRDKLFVSTGIVVAIFLLTLAPFGSLMARLYGPIYILEPLLIGTAAVSVWSMLRRPSRAAQTAQ